MPTSRRKAMIRTASCWKRRKVLSSIARRVEPRAPAGAGRTITSPLWKFAGSHQFTVGLELRVYLPRHDGRQTFWSRRTRWRLDLPVESNHVHVSQLARSRGKRDGLVCRRPGSLIVPRLTLTASASASTTDIAHHRLDLARRSSCWISPWPSRGDWKDVTEGRCARQFSMTAFPSWRPPSPILPLIARSLVLAPERRANQLRVLPESGR